MPLIRPEQPADIPAIRHVVAQAFQQAFDSTAEADLVDKLRANGKSIVSLVAVEDDQIVGHILFSEVTLGDATIIGLAPVSVLPSQQKQGIGALLINAGIEACRNAGYTAMVVLGHPEYYPRFGFIPACRFGIKSEYDVSDETFMAMELQPGALVNCAGVAKYQPEFNEV
ncbi:MAG TPA: N-acetyltransferase [Blastocatellia bacterium]|nr:N-acetyltransferase [Blastocatellia bacterium]